MCQSDLNRLIKSKQYLQYANEIADRKLLTKCISLCNHVASECLSLICITETNSCNLNALSGQNLRTVALVSIFIRLFIFVINKLLKSDGEYVPLDISAESNICGLDRRQTVNLTVC
jgi:hypothetical protein